MDEILKETRKLLSENSDEKTRQSSKRYFKETINSYGVKSAAVNKISKSVFTQVEHYPKAKIFELCESLWRSGFLEEDFVACNLSFYIHELYEPEDFTVFRHWLESYVNNWASCDTLCNHTIGTFIEMYPEFINQLKLLATSSNRWERRGAAVTLIIPARKGMFLKDILEIADTLLTDRDDLVQKGYGWMLKAASQAHQSEIFKYVMQHKSNMPRTVLRYAIEKMPAEMKKKAMEK